MKSLRLFMLLLLALPGIIGCPDIGVAEQKEYEERVHATLNGQHGSVGSVKQGTFGIPYELICKHYGPLSSEPVQMRFSFSGYGSIYHFDDDASPENLTPMDFSREYTGNSMKILYRPPSIDALSDVDHAQSQYFWFDILYVKAFNRYVNAWQQDAGHFEFHVSSSVESMEFYIDHSLGENEQGGQPSSVTIAAGGTYEFKLMAKPVPADDIQLHSSVAGLGGYLGEIGGLLVGEGILEPRFTTYGGGGTYGHFVYTYPCNYTAPEDITSPVDITARFSIYDPWAKQKRETEVIFHVVPR